MSELFCASDIFYDFSYWRLSSEIPLFSLHFDSLGAITELNWHILEMLSENLKNEAGLSSGQQPTSEGA